LTAAAAFIALAPGLAQAQQAPCASREKILSKLGKDFAEHPVSLGLSSNGTVVEVLASESGSWTIILTKPNGASCVVATGQAWETIERKDGRPAA
jgi:predicted methyltransferase